MDNTNNIVITPTKNEEENLPNLIESIINQSIPPLLWVIVDDGSTDSTPLIISEAKKKHSFIKSIRLDSNPRDLGTHVAHIYKKGTDFATNNCEENKINIDYISVIDADMVIEDLFFEKLICELNKNPRIGIISGGVYYNNNGELLIEKTSKRLPRGGCRMWRYDCFKETGGIPISICWDSVTNVKASLNNWITLQLQDAISIQSRPTSGAEGLWKGFVNNGHYAYCLNKNPILVFMNFVHYIIKKPHYIGLAYLYGYFLANLKRSKKIDDEQVKDYYWNSRIKEYLRLN